jgi:hypothetical protein
MVRVLKTRMSLLASRELPANRNRARQARNASPITYMVENTGSSSCNRSRLRVSARRY